MGHMSQHHGILDLIKRGADNLAIANVIPIHPHGLPKIQMSIIPERLKNMLLNLPRNAFYHLCLELITQNM